RKEKLDPIEGMPPDLIRLGTGCPFYPRCKFHVDRCKEENPPLITVAEAHQSACWEWERVARAAKSPEPAPAQMLVSELGRSPNDDGTGPQNPDRAAGRQPRPSARLEDGLPGAFCNHLSP